MRSILASVCAAAVLVPAFGRVLVAVETITYGPCPVTFYTPTTTTVPVTQTITVAYPSTHVLTAVDYSISGVSHTTVQSWTTDDSPEVTSTSMVATLQCTGTQSDFILSMPTVVATVTDSATTTTVTAYSGSPVTLTATSTVSFFS